QVHARVGDLDAEVVAQPASDLARMRRGGLRLDARLQAERPPGARVQPRRGQRVVVVAGDEHDLGAGGQRGADRLQRRPRAGQRQPRRLARESVRGAVGDHAVDQAVADRLRGLEVAIALDVGLDPRLVLAGVVGVDLLVARAQRDGLAGVDLYVGRLALVGAV